MSKPITTDLRRWFDQHMKLMADEELREGFGELCDAIDAVQANLERENDALYAENDALRHERDDGWMELPRDADGEPWHIGDVTESGQTVSGMSLNRHGWSFVGIANEIDPAIHRHYVPDTWERIIKDAVNVHGNGFNPCWTDERDALVARCRALAGDA